MEDFRPGLTSLAMEHDLLGIFKPLQYEKAKVQSGDTATWDLSLLTKALQALLSSKPPFVTDPLRVAALTCLRDMRNI